MFVTKQFLKTPFLKFGFLRFNCSSDIYNLIKCGSVINGGSVNRYFSYGSRTCNILNCLTYKLFSCRKNESLCFNRYYSSDPFFSLNSYDCIGFDLDNTICEYNLHNVVRHEYNALAEFLVQKLGHNENALNKPLLSSDVDFLQKGLIIDTGKGNLLRTRRDGFIFKACHGSRFLSSKEIEKSYGKDRRWKVTTEFAHNPVVAWNGPLSYKMRTLADYFDMPAALAHIRCLDSKLGSSNFDGSSSEDFQSIWKDIHSSLLYIYDRKNFALNLGYFNVDFKDNPSLYYNRCKPVVLNWLRELKNRKITFLITGSHVDHASHTAAYCLGDDWRDYFDIVICYSRKPGFFVGGRPFVELNGFREVNSIGNNEIKIGGIYSQGNWQGLHELLMKVTKKTNPKCVYIGDNLIQDVFTASEYTCCDTVAISEELDAEFQEHPYKDFLASDVWGSYFNDDSNRHSLWGDIIRNYSKICIPNLEVLASRPLDYRFDVFSDTSSGFHSSIGPLDLVNLREMKKHNSFV